MNKKIYIIALVNQFTKKSIILRNGKRMKMKNVGSKTLVCTSVLTALFAASAFAETLDPNDIRNQSAAAVDLATEAKQAFYDSSSSKLHSFLYFRDREERKEGESFKPNIENQTLQLAWDYKSGYFKDTVGLDIWANINQKIGDTTGMSEILYFDHECANDPSSQTYDPATGKTTRVACEKSYAALSVVALKAKFGDDAAGLALRGGYTPINFGTIRSSWGLNPHAYRGIEAKAHFGNWVVGYAFADEFKNDWRKDFLPMTTVWHQQQNPLSPTQGYVIDYIQTVGAVYNFDGGSFDVGYGIGKEYRTNWQALAKYGFELGSAKVDLTGFYHGSIAEETKLTGVKDAKVQSYIGFGANIKQGNFTWIAGVSATDTQGEELNYNFRLTPWANSDNRSFQQTLSGLDDYNTDGTRAVKLGVNYNFASFGVPGLSAGMGGNYATHVRSDAQKAIYDGSMYSVDWNVGYKFLDGGLEGLNIQTFRSLFRGDDIVHKNDRNDLKVLISYSVTLK